MESSIWKHAAKFLRDKKRSRRWLMAFACLAVVVAGGTVAVLKYNGQAMTYTQKVLECGFQVHKHTESCYTTVDGQRTLICGQADYVVHTHNDDCYDAGGKLVCPLPEVEEHKHDSSCYKTQSVPVCGQEESAGHAHDDSCYTTQRGALTCEVPEHTHTDACYDETGTLICGLVEHIHTDNCYAVDQTLTCGLEEGAGAHTHTDACYQTEKVLDCGKLENHTHTDACRDENGKLICGKLELKEHVHNAECIKTVELTAEEVAALSASKKDEDSAGESENIFFTDLDGENEDSTLESGLEDSTVEDESKLDETTEPEYQWLSASGDDYTVTVAFPEDALPENAELNVREIAKDTAEYESYYAQMVETLLKQSEAETEDELELKEPRFFDIAFMVDGEEVEPTQPVVVNISYQDGNHWTEETYGIAVHFTENGDTETIPTDTGADGYTFVGNSFSVYGVAEAAANAWSAGGASTLAADGTITSGEAYVLVVKSGNSYYALKSDGTAQKVDYDPDSNTVSSSADAASILWTYTETNSYYGYATLSCSGKWVTLSNNGVVVGTSSANLRLTNSGNGFTVSYRSNYSGSTRYLSFANESFTTSYYSSTIYFATIETTGIHYDLNLDGVVANNDTLPTKPAVTGIEEEIAVPNKTSFNGKTEQLDTGDYSSVFTFLGWALKGNNATPATDEEIKAAAQAAGGSITVYAVWSHEVPVNLYVNLNALDMSRIEETINQAKGGDWTKKNTTTMQRLLITTWERNVTPPAIYNFIGYDNRNEKDNNNALVLPKTNETIRSMTEQPITIREYRTKAVDGNSPDVVADDGINYTFQWAQALPSDADVLNEICRQVMEEGKTITLGDGKTTVKKGAQVNGVTMNSIADCQKILNDTNYTVYWQILKNNKSDGWHLDGVLVAKSAYLNVKKTFYGLSGALESVAGADSAFNITVTGVGDKEAAETLKLSGGDITPQKNESENAVTYTWTLPLVQGKEYTIKEDSYECKAEIEGVKIAALAEYRITQTDTGAMGWTAYNSQTGITPVVPMVYTDDVAQAKYKTVELRNSYVKTNSLTLHKVDENGDPLTGVAFQLESVKAGASEQIRVQKESAGVYQITEDTAAGTEMEVDSNGNLTIYGLIAPKYNGTYRLIESKTPAGYNEIEPITFELNDAGMLSGPGITTADEEKYAYSVDVVNTSRKISVTAEKVWKEAEADSKPVTFQLYQNGVSMGSDYTVILDGKNDGWSKTWDNLPQYVGGRLAEYSVRENQIGDTRYSQTADKSDGYAGYIVTREAPVTDDEGNITLTVTNQIDKGSLQLTKADKDDKSLLLPGAEFALYAYSVTNAEYKADGSLDVDKLGVPETNSTYTATSGERGSINFANLDATKIYQLKEIKAPNGYLLSDQTYIVVPGTDASTKKVTFKLYDSENGVEIRSQTILNEAAPVPLPESGGPGTTLYTFGGIALLAICLVYGCSLRRRREGGAK